MSGQVIPIRREFVDEHGTRWVWNPEPQDHDGSIIPCPGAVEPLRLPPRPGRKAEMMRLGIRYFGALLAVALLLSAPSAEARSSAYQSYNVAGRSAQWQGFSPTWLVGVTGWWVASRGVTSVVGPVTATGTTPPTVTLAGTPIAAQTSSATPYVELDCTTLGILGTSKYTLKLNGTTVATNVASASSGVSIPGSGLTAGWAAGASATNDVYVSDIVASAWADQSGNANTCSQATAAKQPVSVAFDTGYSGHATLAFVRASSQAFGCTKTFGAAQPITSYIVGESTSGAAQQELIGDSTTNPTVYWPGTVWGIAAGSVLATSVSTQASALAFCGIMNGSASALYINSSTTAKIAGSGGTNAYNSGPAIGAQTSTGTNSLNGKIAELVTETRAGDASERWRMFVYFANQYGGAWQ